MNPSVLQMIGLEEMIALDQKIQTKLITMVSIPMEGTLGFILTIKMALII
jgi:hypothetical protein